jgi:ethanolamine transporter EutH
MTSEETFSAIGALWLAMIIITPVAAWLTHVVTCLVSGEWGFLIAGAIFFPAGIVHGVGIWFGAF